MSAALISRERKRVRAYFFRSTMPHTLESLQPGTPVYVGDIVVGEVRAVYAEGASRHAELLVVFWTDRNEEVALPANDVASVDERGVSLINLDLASYATLAKFELARFPTVRRLP